ncbi:UNVERIFIED_CONTAM: hypothetical protein Cloal_2055 [Acetivibrio alkalicellulosi]
MAKKLALSLSMFVLYVVLILGGSISEEVFGTFNEENQNDFEVTSNDCDQEKITQVLKEKIELSDTDGERVVLILLEDKDYDDVKKVVNEKFEEICEDSFENMQAYSQETRMYLVQVFMHQIQ